MNEIKPFKVVKVKKYEEEWKNQTDGTLVLARVIKEEEIPLYLCYRYITKKNKDGQLVPYLVKELSIYKPSSDMVNNILDYERQMSVAAIKTRENKLRDYKELIEKVEKEIDSFKNEISLIDQRKITVEDLTHEKLDLGGEYE